MTRFFENVIIRTSAVKKGGRVKILKKSAFVLMCIMSIVGFIFLTEWFLSTASGDESGDKILGIDSVENLKTEYYVNESLTLKDVKICLQTDESKHKLIALKETYVSGFDTAEIGNFQMTINYGLYSYNVEYSVSFKEIAFAENYDFSFELNENVDLEKYRLNLYDVDGNIVEQKNLADAELYNFDTKTITTEIENKFREATIVYKGVSKTFKYDVFYFSNSSNYVGKSEVYNGCVYEIVEFRPDHNGYIKILKRIAENELVESIYEFDLKRIDGINYSTFLKSKAIAKLSFLSKKLTFFKETVGNSEEITVDLFKKDKENFDVVTIKSILSVENIRNCFYMNEEVDFYNAKAILLLSDKRKVEVDLQQDDIKNFSTDEVGKFTLKVNYYKFVYYFSYVVQYKKIEFYSVSNNQNQVLTFKVNSNQIFDYSLVCFDFYDEPVEIKLVEDFDVELLNFDNSSITDEGKIRKATILCNGASFEFAYIVIN